MNRRQFILTGVALGVTASLGVYSYQSVTRQDETNKDIVLSALLPALLYGALPEDATLASDQIIRTKEAVIEFMAFLPKRDRQELDTLFNLLANQLGQLALTGYITNMSALRVAQRLQILERWRNSYLQLLVQAYLGLRELLYGAYYGQEQHWQRIHYQAPRFR